jgi:hypothetical protein
MPLPANDCTTLDENTLQHLLSEAYFTAPRHEWLTDRLSLPATRTPFVPVDAGVRAGVLPSPRVVSGRGGGTCGSDRVVPYWTSRVGLNTWHGHFADWRGRSCTVRNPAGMPIGYASRDAAMNAARWANCSQPIPPNRVHREPKQLELPF